MNEEDVFLAQYNSGQKEALFNLMLFFYNDLFKYGVKFTADAEFTKETINQFFLHIWDKGEKLKQVKNIKPYIIVSFKHFLIQELRLNKNIVFLDTSKNEPIELPYEAYLIATEENLETKKILHKEIAALPWRQKQLVQLRFYEQMSIEEIAFATSLTKRTVYNKLHEALKTMRCGGLAKKICKHLPTFLLFF